MATIETKTYPMCNYNTSAIIVVLRDTSVTMGGGRRDNPFVYPFTMAELQQIANASNIIQTGWLRPAKEIEEFIYDALRIQNWRDILTDEEIEAIILHPTIDGLNKLLSIKESLYFERVYGAYIGLKNVNAPIAANIERLIKGRYNELQHGKLTTEFVVQAKDIPTANNFTSADDSSDEINELKDKVEQQSAMIDKLLAELGKIRSEPVKNGSDVVRSAPKSIKRKTTTKKTTEV